MIIAEELGDLSKLTAAELAQRLRDYYASVGGLVCESDIEIAREAVRRARRAETAEDALRNERRQKRSA